MLSMINVKKRIQLKKATFVVHVLCLAEHQIMRIKKTNKIVDVHSTELNAKGGRGGGERRTRGNMSHIRFLRFNTVFVTYYIL